MASGWSPVTSGVLQGGILGPLLFVIFINDFPDNISSETNSALYADDSKLFRVIRSTDDCLSLQKDLDNLEKWSTESKMKFNSSKCKVLSITRKQKPVKYPYHIYGNELSTCQAEKDLGILVSSDLKWGPHILKIVAKANKMLGLLKRTCFKITNIQVRRALYLSLVKSQLSYATEIWCPSGGRLSKKIEGVQRRATLWILSKNRGELTYVERLTLLNMIPLVYDREMKDLVFYYKCKHNITDLNILQYAPITVSRTRAGSSSLLKTPYCKTSTFQGSYFIRIVKLWNYVLKSAPPNCFHTISLFKSYLRKTYFDLTVSNFNPDMFSSHSITTF